MTDCPEERKTQHFRGRFYGFGPVRDDETVIFAVFQSTKRVGQRLIANSFDNKHLKNAAQSLARRSFVTKKTFNKMIVRQETLDGIATAKTAEIRALVADVKSNARAITVRSLCVLDRVDAGDCEGHATTGYSEQHASLGISQTQLSKVRAKIRLDLADAFSDVRNEQLQKWPSDASVTMGRILSIARGLLFQVTDLATKIATGQSESKRNNPVER